MSVAEYGSSPDLTAVPWIESPFFDRLFASSSLPDSVRGIVQSFARDGYVVIDPGIAENTLDGAIADLDGRYVANGSASYYSDSRRIQDAWNLSEHVRSIATAPRVLEILQALYRRTPIPFQTLNFRIGSEQRTHSDAAFFDSIPSRFMAGVWVALEDVDGDNGPLRYYPGSQKLPPWNLSDLGVLASNQSHELENLSVYEDFVEALIASSPYEEKRLHIRKGQALIWAANLYHGGSPILDPDRTRFSQVTHYYFAGCMYYTPLTSDLGLGRLSPRNVFNVASGRQVPQYYQGRRIENAGEWPPRLSTDAAITDPRAFPTRVPRSPLAMLRRAFGR